MKSKAVVFAGQGAQFVGMGKDLCDADPECRELFDRADAVLGFPLSKLCFEGPIEELTKSSRCQPAIFVTSVACRSALGKAMPELRFDGTAGLSLGEWTALHVAGALSFDDTLRILEARGRFMQQACDERAGAMVSVMGLPADTLRSVCTAAGVEIANLNSADQTVLSGDRERILKAEKLAQEAGAKRTVLLNVAGAFHSSLMAPAAARLADVLAGVEVRQPVLPVVSNVTGRPHTDPESIRRDMVRQVTSSVLWASCVEWFMSKGIGSYVECGPGKVLSGLIKRIDKAAEAHSVQDRPSLEKAVVALRLQS